MRKEILSFIVLALSLIGGAARADRQLVIPQLQWHDWFFASWAQGDMSQRCFDFILTNIGDNNTDVNVVAIPNTSLFAVGSRTVAAPNFDMLLSASCWPGGSCITINATTPLTSMIQTVTVPNHSSAQVTYCATYRAQTAYAATDWHLVGGMDINLTVKSDRGAMTGSIHSRMELNGPNPDVTTFPYAGPMMSLRDANIFKDLNGGRPF